MRFDAQRTVKLALIAAATLSLAACASTKPATPPQPGPAGPAPSGGGSYIPPAGPGPIDSRPIPGTTQDFIINIGDFVYFDLDQYVVRADAAPVLDAQSPGCVAGPMSGSGSKATATNAAPANTTWPSAPAGPMPSANT